MGQFRRIDSMQKNTKFVFRYPGLPVPCDAGREHKPCKQGDYYDSERECRPDFFAETRCLEFQRVFHGTYCGAIHTPGAFGADNAKFPIHRQVGRTYFGTTTAGDTSVRIPLNSRGTEKCKNSHQCAIRTQIATPEIFYRQGSQC